MLRNLLGDGGDPGGGTPDPTPAPAPAPELPADLPEWAKGIEADLMMDPVMKNVRDIPSLVKGYVHAQRLVGRDKVVVPTEKSKPEEWKAYFNKVGLPEKIDDYKVDIKDSMFSPEQMNKIKAMAYENNVLPHQFQKLMETFGAEQNAIIEQQTKASEQSLAEATEALKKEWGEGFQKNIHNARTVVKHFGGEDTLKYLEESGLANDVNLVKFLAGIGAKLNKEDTFQKDVSERFGLTKDEAKARLNNMYADTKHPMFNREDPRHDDALKEMLRYQEILAS